MKQRTCIAHCRGAALWCCWHIHNLKQEGSDFDPRKKAAEFVRILSTSQGVSQAPPVGYSSGDFQQPLTCSSRCPQTNSCNLLCRLKPDPPWFMLLECRQRCRALIPRQGAEATCANALRIFKVFHVASTH